LASSSAVAQEHVLFAHSDKCVSLLNALLLPFATTALPTQACSVDWSSCNEFCKILEIYQEQGHLLDPHLESMVAPLMAAIQRSTREAGVAQQRAGLLSAIGKCVYTLSKVRGYKVVTKFFPHEAIDLEGCLLLLALTPPPTSRVGSCGSPCSSGFLFSCSSRSTSPASTTKKADSP